MLDYRSNRQFQEKVRNFPTEAYRIDDSSTHIFKLMYTLLELGVGQVYTWQDQANNSESMAGTMFNDLDALFAFLGVIRLPGEIYDYDPYHQQLTNDQWNEVFTKDALFRLRITKFMQALLRGGTLEGVKMAAEAASGVIVQVFEMWRVISGQGLATGVTLGRSPLLLLAKEFVVIPLEQIDDEQRAAIIHLVDLIKPVNTISTVHTSPSLPQMDVDLRSSASEDYFFEIRRLVSASDDLLFQDPDVWIMPNAETEGPTFAFMSTMGATWSLNQAVNSVKAFSIDDNFLLTFGTLIGAINNSVESIVVDEADEPAAPSFPIKIDDEEFFVSERTPVVGSETQYTYTVLRAQNGTVAASHLNLAAVNNGAIPMFSDVQITSQFGPFRDIPLADSPDNFPAGQFPGDPSKYDGEGNYTFDYSSQSEYTAWFTYQVQLIGGEVVGTQFRLPISVDDLAGTISSPDDALAAPEFDIQMKVFPGVQ